MGMTSREAIDTIRTAIGQVEWEYPMDYAAAFDMAIQALEKQEARMLTREEAQHLKDDTDVWVQQFGEIQGDDLIFAGTVIRATQNALALWESGFRYFNEYGPRAFGWVIWTNRPTEEQLKGVEWI